MRKILTLFFVSLYALGFDGLDFGPKEGQKELKGKLDFGPNEWVKIIMLDENMKIQSIQSIQQGEGQITINLPNQKASITIIPHPSLNPKKHHIQTTAPNTQAKKPALASSKATPKAIPNTPTQTNPQSTQSSQSSQDLQSSLSNAPSKYQERFWRNQFMGGILGFEPYKYNYLLPLSYSTKDTPNHARNSEAKFQISIKKMLFDNLFFDDLDMYFSYTQQSFWQIYDSNNSRPFRQSNYEPSLYFTTTLPYQNFFERINFGYVHQSNGGDLSNSRSWDRLFLEGVHSYGNLFFGLKAWARIPESKSQDDNPDITRFLGYGELSFGYLWQKHAISATLRNNLRAKNKGSILLDYSYPLYKNLYFYLQYFNGYGESLKDYNHSINRIGIGFLFSR